MYYGQLENSQCTIIIIIIIIIIITIIIIIVMIIRKVNYNFHKKISQNPLRQFFKKLHNFDNFIRRNCPTITR